jgi:hypothetical protein
VERRSTARVLVVTVVALAIVAALGWGGTALVRKAADKLGSGTGSPSGGRLLTFGAPIDLSGVSGAVAVTASDAGVFYTTTSAGRTTVHGLWPQTGEPMWTRDVSMNPTEASLRTVGGFLVLDGKKSATDGGRDIRVVLDPMNGSQKQKLDWTQRTDVAYVGMEAIAATTSRPYQTVRVNLLTGSQVWTSTPIASVNAWHPVKPELTWAVQHSNTPGQPDNLPAVWDGFAESFGVNGDRFVQLDASGGTAQVLDGAGKVTVSGKVTVDDDILDDLWTAFDGLLIGAMKDGAPGGGTGFVTAYQLDNLKPAWSTPVGIDAGDDVRYVHPCGEHLVCAGYDRHPSGTSAVVGIDTRTGQWLEWNKMPAAQFGGSSTKPSWLVLDSKVVYGASSFPPQISCQDTGIEVVDATNGATVRTLASPAKTSSATVIGAAGRYVAVRTVGVHGTETVWRIALLDLVTGRQTAPMDIGSGDHPPQQAAINRNEVAVLGADRKLYIATAPDLPL